MKNEMWLIWKSPESRRRYKVGILIENELGFTFKYVNPELKEAIDVGFDFFPGFDDHHKIYNSDKLFTNIATRLPNEGRPDYLEILNAYNLDKDSTKFEILKATKGRLLTDNYEFVPAFDLNKVEFDVAGTRYCCDVDKCKNILEVNDRLYLELDFENNYDKNAIKVIYKKNNINYHLGYVPRYYSKELAEVLNKNIKYSALIHSLNFSTELLDENITACVKLIFDI